MISDIRLQNFRSYTDESYEFDEGVNIIVGPNASGKTNLLEGLLVSCVGSSYRVRDSELVQHGKPWARVDAHKGKDTRTIKIEFDDKLTPNKSFSINDQQFKRLPFHKSWPVVLFEPNHLQLLHGSPEGRRDFLDSLLEHTEADFSTIKRQYKRTLLQRNALLKQDPLVAKSQLFAWNIRLSELAGQVVARRLALIAKLNKLLPVVYRKLSSAKIGARIDYFSSCETSNYTSNLHQKLDRSTELDFQRGFTAYGPHREDMHTYLGKYLAEETASRGEVRTLLVSLKIIEMQLLEDTYGGKPVLLLDDVFSELDGARRRALTDFLSGHQTFITTTDADVVVQHFMGMCNIIPLGA